MLITVLGGNNLNRLFRNTGIGRETRHLMVMVTPRIIIASEEEERATGER